MASRWGSMAGALACVIAAFQAGAAPPRKNPFLGEWTYVAAGSKFAGRAPYRSATVSFAADGGGMRVTEDVVTANGARFPFEYTDPMDGTYVTVRGNPYYDSESSTWTDARTVTRTERRGGTQTGTTVMTMAPDGRSFTADAKRTVPEGGVYTAYVVWKRAAR